MLSYGLRGALGALTQFVNDFVICHTTGSGCCVDKLLFCIALGSDAL